tara:strand:+ start:1886 stop:2131 length:246 start_codon:yes stop_codon:yes gene_type:complete
MIDQQLDDIYDIVDDLFDEDLFGKVDTLLACIDPALDIDLMLGWLTVTLPAKHLLKNRDRLVSDLKGRLERKDWNILEGLE